MLPFQKVQLRKMVPVRQPKDWKAMKAIRNAFKKLRDYSQQGACSAKSMGCAQCHLASKKHQALKGAVKRALLKWSCFRLRRILSAIRMRRATRHAAERAVEIAYAKLSLFNQKSKVAKSRMQRFYNRRSDDKGSWSDDENGVFPLEAEYDMLVLGKNILPEKIVPRKMPQEYRKAPEAEGLAWLFRNYKQDMHFAHIGRRARLCGVQVIAELRNRKKNKEKPFTDLYIETLQSSRTEATTALATAAETHITEISEQLATLFYKEKLNATKQECFRQLYCVTKHNEDTQQARRKRFEDIMDKYR